MPHPRARVRGVALGVLALVLLTPPVLVQAETRSAVQASTLEFVDARSGQAISQVAADRPFWVRYTVANEYSYPVLVTEVRSEIEAAPDCGVADLAPQPRGSGLPVVLPGGTAAWVGEDSATWVRTQECSSKIGWRAEVVAERVPSTTSLRVENHRFGEATRLEATVRSDWAAQRGRVQFLLDGSLLEAVEVRDGGAVLDVPARTIQPGEHSVVARYQPVVDGPAGSRSEPVELRVSEADRESATTAAASSQRHDRPGELRAEVRPRDGSGTVQFLVDGEPWGEPVALRGGRATLATGAGALDVGRHVVAATFASTDPGLAGSTSAAETFDIGQVPASISATLSPSRITRGDPITITGRVELGAGRTSLPADSRVDVLDTYGSRVARTTPEPDGTFTLTTVLPESARVGPSPLFVSFPGNQTYGGAMVETTIQVRAPVSPAATESSPAPSPSPASPSPTGPGAAGGDAPEADRSDDATDSLLPGAPLRAPLLMGLALVLAGAALTLRQVWRR